MCVLFYIRSSPPASCDKLTFSMALYVKTICRVCYQKFLNSHVRRVPNYESPSLKLGPPNNCFIAQYCNSKPKFEYKKVKCKEDVINDRMQITFIPTEYRVCKNMPKVFAVQKSKKCHARSDNVNADTSAILCKTPGNAEVNSDSPPMRQHQRQHRVHVFFYSFKFSNFSTVVLSLFVAIRLSSRVYFTPGLASTSL